MDKEKPLLSVSHLTKQFGGVMAVHDVSFAIYPRQIVSVIGPNGAGKTTLFNMITAVIPPTSGSVHFMDREVTRMRPCDIAKLGMTRTFQNLQVFRNMSVVENVMTGAHVKLKTGLFRSALRLPSVKKEENATLQKSIDLLNEIGLYEQAYENAATLPYGSQRLLEIARAAASDPKIILLDEPMAGLNPQESKELVQNILAMRNAGMTFLFVEHDMETVMSIADHIVVLDFGERIAEGTPQEIYQNPKVIAAYLGDEEVAISC
jgi:branched-chain amino acid transport system ATP-binding protein